MNKCWLGSKRKSADYREYEKILLTLLPNNLWVPYKGKICISATFGFSNRGSDLDNHIKPLLDILANKYNFNDNRVYEIHLFKKVVLKGEEYLKFIMEEI